MHLMVSALFWALLAKVHQTFINKSVRLNLLAPKVWAWMKSGLFLHQSQKCRGLRFNILVSNSACRQIPLRDMCLSQQPRIHSSGDDSLLTIPFEQEIRSGPSVVIISPLEAPLALRRCTHWKFKGIFQNYFCCHWCETTPPVSRTAGTNHQLPGGCSPPLKPNQSSKCQLTF